jgi:hypothetical protein
MKKIFSGEELHIHIKMTEITKVVNLNQYDLPRSTDQIFGMDQFEQLFLMVETETT